VSKIKSKSMSFKCDVSFQLKLAKRLERCNRSRNRQNKKSLSMSQYMRKILDNWSSGDPYSLDYEDIHREALYKQDKRQYIHKVRSRIAVNDSALYDMVVTRPSDKKSGFLVFQLSESHYMSFLSCTDFNSRSKFLDDLLSKNLYFDNSKDHVMMVQSVHKLDGKKVRDSFNLVWGNPLKFT